MTIIEVKDRTTALINKLLEVTEDEINRYYEEEIYGNYTVKHILIKPETKDDISDTEIEEAENKAK